MTVQLITIEGVPLAKVGDWPVNRGWGRFTEQDLESMAVEASRGMRPRLKIGHGDKGVGAIPAWGQVANLRVEPDAQGVLTLLGDYVNVPRKLAEILPTALPGRSIEAVRGRSRQDGSKIPMVATAVALLGTEEPAMNTLGDHAAIDGLHSVTVGESDLVVHAARLLAEMSYDELVQAMRSSVDSAGDEHTTEDQIVPDENPTTEEQPTPDAAPETAPTAPEPTEAPETETEGDETPAASSSSTGEVVSTTSTGMVLPDGVVAIDAKVLEQLQRDAELGRQANEQLVAASRTSDIERALEEGRIAPASREQWESAHERDPEGTRSLLATLAPNTVPVHAERGHAGDPASLSNDDDAAYAATFGRFDRNHTEA